MCTSILFFYFFNQKNGKKMLVLYYNNETLRICNQKIVKIKISRDISANNSLKNYPISVRFLSKQV